MFVPGWIVDTPTKLVRLAIAISLAIRLANIAGDLLAVALVHAVYVVHTASTRLRRITAEVECAAAAEPVL